MSKWVEYKLWVYLDQADDTYDQIIKLPGVIDMEWMDMGEDE